MSEAGKKLKVRAGDPAGNITLFVTAGEVSPKEYADVAAQLMRRPDLHGEQVGYVVKPLFGGMGRLEMMGGEFCGNAARTFACLLGEQYGIETGQIRLEISGCDKLLEAVIDRQADTASVEMPLPRKTGRWNQFPVVHLGGISHLITEGPLPDEAETYRLLRELVKEEEIEAAGIVSVQEDTMTPAVYVAATDTLVYESSCGSGTVAAAVWKCEGAADGNYHFPFRQPGGVITAEVNVQEGRITSVRIGGAVTLGPEQEIEL